MNLTGFIWYCSSINNIFVEKVKGCNRIHKHLLYFFSLLHCNTLKIPDRMIEALVIVHKLKGLLSLFSTASSTYVMLGNTVSRTDLSHLLSCDY